MKQKLKTLAWSDFPKPCYDPQEAYGDFNGTIMDILKDERIPAKDRIWAFTREGVSDDRTLRLFACKCVRSTPLGDGRVVWDLLTDPRSRHAVEVAERFANGNATAAELAAAWDAAWEAAGEAAWAAWAARAAGAAWAAAWDAAWAARAARAAGAAWAAWAAIIQFAIELITENYEV